MRMNDVRNAVAPRHTIARVVSYADGVYQLQVPGQEHTFPARSMQGWRHGDGDSLLVTLEPNPQMATIITTSPFRV